MNCEQALALISARIDRAIEPDQCERLDAHLTECSACRATDEAFRLQDIQLRSAFAPRRQAASAGAERVIEKLREMPAHAAGSRPQSTRRKEAPMNIVLRRLALVAGAAAALVVFVFLLQLSFRLKVTPVAPAPQADALPIGARPDRLIARSLPPPPPVVRVGVGDTVQTTAGQRRRVVLPDNSILYVNQNTSVHLDTEQHLTLSSGEVFVEVAPRPMLQPFTIKTAQREVSALGTKLDVRADDAGKTNVVVTQGFVLVHDQGPLLLSGQQLSPDSAQPTPAPRASYLLDWTRELMAAAESPLVPGSKHAGGELIAVDPYGQEAKLSLRKQHIDVHIEDGFARTTIDQTFFNHELWRLEGTFYFPLPPDASLSRLAMYVGEDLMEGGMAERDYARQVYERIVSTQRDPALLEWVDGSTFKMRVFPLEGRQEKRIVLSYTQRLSSLYGRTQYRFPAGHSLDLVRDWKFHAFVKGGANLNPVSNSHPDMKFKKVGDDLVLDDSARNVKADRDVAVDLYDNNLVNQVQDVARFSSAEHDGSRYLMLRYRPWLPGKAERQRRDWVFLFESSADRDPLLARAQIEIIRTLLNNAEHDDTFVILTAGTRVGTFAAEAKEATPENVNAAIAFLENTHLIGALDLGGALSAAEPFLKASKNPYLVHVGSGVAAVGERREDMLAKRIPERVPYVGVGVGKHWSRNFMKMAAERTSGYFTQINPDEAIGWRSFELFSTLNTPRLLDLKVVDKEKKAVFLNYANTLAQGEELCAIARIGTDETDTPHTLTITGKLDGVEFQREVPVGDIAPKADYLPRTWAKLEIDRLLAENSRENKDKIIVLSKAMYVMTPFTSLLVLENEEMYKEFKVDRGRKDHWAMYPCPPKIPIVYEPDPTQPTDARNAPQTANQKPRSSQILQTILLRMPPRMIHDANRRSDYDGQIVTALQLYTGTSRRTPVNAEPLEELGLISNGDTDTKWPSALNINGIGGDFDGEMPPVVFFNSVSADGTVPAQDWGFRFDPSRPRGTTARHPPLGELRGKSRQVESSGFDAAGEFPFLMAGTSLALNPEGRRRAVRNEELERLHPESDRLVEQLSAVRKSVREQQNVRAWTEHAVDRLGLDTTDLFLESLVDVEHFEGRRILDPNRRYEVGGRMSNESRTPPLYERSYFSSNPRIFSDLAAYAPGMNTNWADIQAVVENEAAPKLSSTPGSIDPEARKLIEQARTTAWHALRIRGKGRPDITIHFDHTGRYAYDRILPLGLREQVVCDSQTLLHLYPELGIGARRTISRFHRSEMAQLTPWVLPPAEDLARGADLRKVGERVVALVPRGAETARDKDGKPVGYFCVHLIFDADGRLNERRSIEMPAGPATEVSKAKTLFRETYAADDVKLFDADGKEISSRKLDLSDAQQPSLNPDTSSLVVLPLPLRTRQHVYPTLDLNAHQPLNAGINGCYEYLPPEDAVALFAAEYASQNGPNARQVFFNCFHKEGQRKPGFYTLLAACGVDVSSEPELRKLWDKNPADPLLTYLLFHGSKVYSVAQSRLSLEASQHVKAEGSFLRSLAEFRDRSVRWQRGQTNRSGTAWRRAEQERSLDFIRRHKDSVLGLALLYAIQEYGLPDANFHLALAEVWKLYDDGSDTAYLPRYERARNLFYGGQREEARRLFQEVYEKTFAKGVLPPIDGTFVQCLRSVGGDDAWSALMRKTAQSLLKDHHRPAAVALAWQCWQLGEQPLAENLLTVALEQADEKELLETKLAAIEYLWHTDQLARADDLLQSLLANSTHAERAGLWRLGAHIAEQRGMTDRSIACLERALDIEYRNLPDVINLQTLRADYGKLLEHYRMLAQAARAIHTAPPGDLLPRVIRAADRWRALDREDTSGSQSAAQTLKVLGDHDLAWDYLTTPISLRPTEASSLLSMAQSLSREGDLELADRAYALAFEAEPTNLKILWDRARNFQQAGKASDARKLLEQIASGKEDRDWNWIRGEARWQLQNQK